MAPSFAIESFTDVEADVRHSIARVRHSPFVLHRDRVRGFAYDVDTGLLSEVKAYNALGSCAPLWNVVVCDARPGTTYSTRYTNSLIATARKS